ncbi:MAG: methyltransferase [Cyclobacteriaceae bacterium]|nr:MAG: methyltransferase [Cyclobacteriaceae bacterium]
MAYSETEKLNQILIGAALSNAVCTVTELGIPDLITAGTPVSAESLAQSIGAHQRSLYRIMRYLASYGIFKETPNAQFDHTALSEALRADAEGSYRAGARTWFQLFPTFGTLHHSIMTGEAGFIKEYGKPIFEFLGENPAMAPLFDAAMTSFHGYETQAMLDAYDFSGIKVLADIGGGIGSLIGSVLQSYPEMKGILFELGHVLGRAEESLKSQGLGDRCKFIEGNFFESVVSGADAYIFRHIIHDWTDEQSVQILGNCRKVIPADGKLLLVECVIPTGNERSISKDFDIVMMIAPGGIERTEQEFKDLFSKSGFQLTSVTSTSTMVSIIEGTPV